MMRGTTRSVQRERFKYSLKDLLAVYAGMFGVLLLALLAVSHGVLVAVSVTGFLAGWAVRKAHSASGSVARSRFGRRQVSSSGYRALGRHA